MVVHTLPQCLHDLVWPLTFVVKVTALYDGPAFQHDFSMTSAHFVLVALSVLLLNRVKITNSSDRYHKCSCIQVWSLVDLHEAFVQCQIV